MGKLQATPRRRHGDGGTGTGAGCDNAHEKGDNDDNNTDPENGARPSSVGTTPHRKFNMKLNKQKLKRARAARAKKDRPERQALLRAESARSDVLRVQAAAGLERRRRDRAAATGGGAAELPRN